MLYQTYKSMHLNCDATSMHGLLRYCVKHKGFSDESSLVMSLDES